jgi:hypothetical protein
MKTIFRSIGLAILAAVFVAAGSTTSFAQAGCDNPEEIEALDKKIRENYGKIATIKIAIDSGKQFLEKYGACEAPKEFADWVKAQLPAWESRYAKFNEGEEMKKLFARFDAGITSDNPDEVYSAGREILAKQPDNLNIMVPMAMSGILASYKNNNKYADDAVKLSNTIVSKLKSGAVATKKNPAGEGTYGALKLEFTKQEALDELAYGMAYITHSVKKDKKAALPMYYEISQTSPKYKNEPRVYATIADYYLQEAARLGDEIAKMIEKQKTLPTDEEKFKFDAEIKAKVGLFNGYTERALDALARAHKVAPSATAAEKTFKDALYKQITDLYKRRFDKDAGLNEYIAAAIAKPFPNPNSEVTPINDPEPVETTNTTSAAPATKPATGKTAVTTKP